MTGEGDTVKPVYSGHPWAKNIWPYWRGGWNKLDLCIVRYAEVQFIPGCSRHRNPAVAEGAVEILTLSTVNAVIKAKVVYRSSDCQRCYQSQGYPLIINGVVEATLPLK